MTVSGHPVGAQFPFVRDAGRCDLCGRTAAKLYYVRVRRATATKLERGAWVCARHEACPDDAR